MSVSTVSTVSTLGALSWFGGAEDLVKTDGIMNAEKSHQSLIHHSRPSGKYLIKQ